MHIVVLSRGAAISLGNEMRNEELGRLARSLIQNAREEGTNVPGCVIYHAFADWGWTHATFGKPSLMHSLEGERSGSRSHSFGGSGPQDVILPSP